MALSWRFIAKSWLSVGAISVMSTARGGDSRSRPGSTTCWGNAPTSGRIGSQAAGDPTPITLNRRSHMTLIKSILMGSAAGIVAVASAQAADLPTKKAAPVEYVKVCNVGGVTGWTLPGSDTCVKFSGYLTAQFEGGNLNTQYNFGSISDLTTTTAGTTTVTTTSGGAVTVPSGTSTTTGIAGTVPSAVAATPSFILSNSQLNQRVLIAANTTQQSTSFFRNEFGWTSRMNFGFDIASNTAYGPLIGHFDLNSEMGNGFDNTGTLVYVNTGYVTWAGITAGKAQSFYSFTGGGDNWNNFFSPDQKGFNEPNLIAYTASFGGGFTATLAAQSQGTVGASGGGTNQSGGYSPGAADGPGSTGPTTFGGQRWPDIVGALHVKQGWGEAQVSGVIHNVNVRDYSYFDTASCGITGVASCNAQQGKVGWGVDAGVK